MTVTEETVEGFKETEVGLLPKDWEVVRLESQLELIKNGITKTQNKESLGYPITRIETIADESIDMLKTAYVNNLNDSEIQRYKLEIEDILFSHINSEPHLGKTAIYKGIPPVLIHGMNLLMLRANKTTMNAYYLNYLCNFYRAKGVFIGLAARAVGQSSINQGKLKALEIALPFLPEQKKIASVLSTIQEAKEMTENVIKATKELKKSMMKHLFTYGPVPVEVAEKVPLKETEIGMIPEHWEVVEMGNYCEFTTGKLNSNQAVPNGLYPFFTCSQETYRIDKYSFDCEAILLSGNNARGIYSVKHYRGKFDAYQRTYVITIKDLSSLDYKYLRYVLETKLENLREGSIGTSTKFLTLKMLLTLRICLSSLQEQQQISATLSAIDNKIEAEENKKQALEVLFKTLLSLLMTGKLRVKDLEIPV